MKRRAGIPLTLSCIVPPEPYHQYGQNPTWAQQRAPYIADEYGMGTTNPKAIDAYNKKAAPVV